MTAWSSGLRDLGLIDADDIAAESTPQSDHRSRSGNRVKRHKSQDRAGHLTRSPSRSGCTGSCPGSSDLPWIAVPGFTCFNGYLCRCSALNAGHGWPDLPPGRRRVPAFPVTEDHRC